MKPIKTALLAYGMSGKIFHAPYLDFLPEFELDFVLERNQKKMQEDYQGITSVSDVEEILSNREIELVVINTPNNTHYDYSLKALNAGKHILVEKPFAATDKEAQEVFELGKKLGLKVMVYQNRRWSSDFLATKDVITSGKLGDIIEMHLRFDRYRPEIGPKKFKEENIPASGIFYDLGAHLLDQAISLFGSPHKYFLTTGNYRPDTKVADFAHLHLQFPNQLNVFITTSLLVADPQPGIVIHGTRGSFVKSFCDTQEEHLLNGGKITDPGFGAEQSGKEGVLTTFGDGSNKSTELIPSREGRYINLFKEVYQTIRLNKEFPVKESDILTQIKILQNSTKENPAGSNFT